MRLRDRLRERKRVDGAKRRSNITEIISEGENMTSGNR